MSCDNNIIADHIKLLMNIFNCMLPTPIQVFAKSAETSKQLGMIMARHLPLLTLLATIFTCRCFATDPGFRIAITNKGLDCGEPLLTMHKVLINNS
jgi:hypothetical protein